MINKLIEFLTNRLAKYGISGPWGWWATFSSVRAIQTSCKTSFSSSRSSTCPTCIWGDNWTRTAATLSTLQRRFWFKIKILKTFYPNFGFKRKSSDPKSQIDFATKLTVSFTPSSQTNHDRCAEDHQSRLLGAWRNVEQESAHSGSTATVDYVSFHHVNDKL